MNGDPASVQYGVSMFVNYYLCHNYVLKHQETRNMVFVQVQCMLLFWCIKVEVKVKFTLEQTTKAQRGVEVSSTLSLTSALGGGGWSMPCPGRFTLAWKTRYPLHRRLGGPQSRSGWVWKISPPTVQPVTSLCTDRDIVFTLYVCK
jgi:hypothetical protein